MITEEKLIEAGYKRKIFFYALGGGEDENDMDIFIKDNVAIGQIGSSWYECNYDSLTYVNGFPDSDPINEIP